MIEDLHESAQLVFRDAGEALIRNATTRQLATDLWDAIRAFRKQAEAHKEEVCRPLKQAWEDTKRPFDEFVGECKQHEAALQHKMSAYDAEQDRLARVAQAKVQAKIDAENARTLAKADAKGMDLSEVVMKVAPVVQAPPKSVATQAGTTQTRSVKKVYKPKDLTSLMTSFPGLFDLSLPKFNALAKTGMLDGRADVEITEEYIYAQRG